MGITYFTNLVYDQIRYAVSSGDCAPFVGHNAFLRWNAIQYISYECEDDNREKWWYVMLQLPRNRAYIACRSESSVSEDFDMSLRLQAAGYLIRLAAYTSPDGELFQEGVSLTVYDELTRWVCDPHHSLLHLADHPLNRRSMPMVARSSCSIRSRTGFDVVPSRQSFALSSGHVCHLPQSSL